MTKFGKLIFPALLMAFLASCVGDDFIADFREPEVRITARIDTLEAGMSFQMDYVYLNNVGEQEDRPAVWQTSDESIATISDDGLLTALSFGDVDVSIHVDDDERELSDITTVSVDSITVVSLVELSGRARTTTFYKLEGDFTLAEDGNGGLILNFDENYCASSGLPGFYVYLSNNRNSIANALEVGRVTTFRGAHEYRIPNTGIMDYSFVVFFCKPFNVKVGDAEIE